ncbi:MAG: hypothetical protein M1834_002918 [Cirrosporium novae-zelandiae]|nr:MAG: hypothetical protein M1834_002918 [Cirrosporium novae-zelandiae]
MADDSSKPEELSIPSWQRAASSSSEPAPKSIPESTSSPAEDASSKPAKVDSISSRSALLEQATIFLQDDDIRDAPTSRKIEFLEKKGLTNDEIQTLLGVSRNVETSESTLKSDLEKEESEIEITEQNNKKAPPNPPETKSTPTSKHTFPSDQPPIITYPEFLDRSRREQNHKSPLLTPRTLLTTAYITAAFGATLWAGTKYILNPMSTSLTEARHDLATITKGHLDEIVEKLEDIVSEVPPKEPRSRKQDEDEGDTLSIDSDPTELFHRDIATQTTPSLVESATVTPPEPSPNPMSVLEKQVTSVGKLQGQLRSAIESAPANSVSQSSTLSALTDLHTYLSTLAYSSSMNYSMGGWPDIKEKEEEDAIEAVKKEIRGVKGVLLAARNFPARTPMRGTGGQ